MAEKPGGEGGGFVKDCAYVLLLMVCFLKSAAIEE